MPRSPDSLRDWFVGGGGKRRLIGALLKANPDRSWTEAELARAAGVHEKNSLRRHLAVLRQADVIRGPPGSIHLNQESPMVDPLTELINSLETHVADEPLPGSRGG